MSAQHTPGPWVVNPQRKTPIVGIDCNDGGDLLPVVDAACGITHAVALANARLIAAAPDLLEALRVAERCIKGYTESSRRECGLDGIRAAIAKATGGAA